MGRAATECRPYKTSLVIRGTFVATPFVIFVQAATRADLLHLSTTVQINRTASRFVYRMSLDDTVR